MKRKHTAPGTDAAACRFSAEAAAFHAGELADPDRRAFELHLAACPVCARELESIRRTMDELQALAPAKAGRDLAPRILARLGEEQARRPALAFPPAYAAAAAALLLLAGIAACWVLRRSHPGSPSAGGAEVAGAGKTAGAPSDAVVWLCRTQQPDGSWSAREWGGDRRYEVALSSLAALAILQGGKLSEEQLAAVRSAAGYLLEQQNPAGEFAAAAGSSPYNHGMATLALLRSYEVLRDESLKPPIDKALQVIRARQMPEGGWGYWGEKTPESNLSVTLWQVEALKLAVAMGWEDARPQVQRAVRWIVSVADGRGQFGYRQSADFPAGPDTLTAMGALAVLNTPDKVLPPGWREKIVAKVQATASDTVLDYYRAYFLTAAMEKMQDEASASQLARVRESLAKRQVADGPQRGSWDPDRQWGSVGGRVYATAMASLSLQRQ